jgi:hypothetical protein
MTEMLQAIKADLLERRLLPFVALLVLALVAAIAYAMLGSGGSSNTPTVSVVSVPQPQPTLSVKEATANPNVAVSETTSGLRYQRKGATHDPFKPLPSTSKAVRAATPTLTSTSTAVSSRGSGSSGGSPAESKPTPSSPTPSTPKQTTKPRQAKPQYVVSVQFALKPSSPAPQPPLPSYELKLGDGLGPKASPLIKFAAVANKAKDARFRFVGEQPPTLQGPARCVPSPTNCTMIQLVVGQTEELQYLQPDGSVATYQLRVLRVTKQTKAAGVARVATRRKKGSRTLIASALLHRVSSSVLGHLRYLPKTAMVVYAPHRKGHSAVKAFF